MKILQFLYRLCFYSFIAMIFYACNNEKSQNISFLSRKKKVVFKHYGHFINNSFLNCMHNGDTLRKCNPEIREVIISKKFRDSLLLVMKDGTYNKAAYIVVNNDSITLCDVNNMTLKFYADGNLHFYGKQIGMNNFFVKAKEQWKKMNSNDLQILPELANTYMLQGAYEYSKYNNFTFQLDLDTLFLTKEGQILNFYPYTAYIACCSNDCFIKSKANTVKVLSEGFWRNYEMQWKRDSLILKELYSTYDFTNNYTYWNYTKRSLLLRKIQ